MSQVSDDISGSNTFASDESRSSVNETASDSQHFHVIIVGTGFAGLGMAIRLKQSGMTDFVILERADDVGGTWRDNTYPGCACDVQSHLYSFSFALNPHWTHAYAPQTEIWRYLRDCTTRFGITPFIRWRSAVLDASWNDETKQWMITTSEGAFTADILIFGQGPLSEPAIPAIPGLETFKGTTFHSATWNHEHDLRGKRVAVIGTGASAIQFVPQIQPEVEHLTLYQRTPPWLMARHDHPIASWKRSLYTILPITQYIARSGIYWLREVGGLAMVYRPQILKRLQRTALTHLDTQISDPALREKLTPNFMMGCKRILLSDDFYPAVAQSNVSLVTEQIAEVREHSIVTTDGQEHPTDTIIFATGFRVTDSPIAALVHGHGGQSLADAWRDGPQAYLGATITGFPNVFMLIGPNTGLGHTSMVYMIESQITYILDCLDIMRRRNLQTVEVLPQAQAAFNEEVQRKMKNTVWSTGCRSWYLDVNGRNTTLWPGFTFEFRRRTRHFDVERYEVTPATIAARV